MTKYLLLTTDPTWARRVRVMFPEAQNGDFRAVNAASLDDTAVVHALHDTDSPVLVVGPGYESDSALALARAVDERRPDVSVILVTESSPALLQEAVRAGVRDVLNPDASESAVCGSLALALETALRRRAALGAALEAGASSKVITVMSPKGGSGKTAMASNLAVGLARVVPNEVAVVDLDLQFGDIANALRITPERTIADLARNSHTLDETTIKAFLTPHPAGMFVLAAPDSPAEADGVKPELVATTLELLGSMFRFVVVDTGAGLDEAALTAAEEATDLVLVCATDVASARGLRKGVETLNMLGFTEQRRHFVLNRADARVGITIQDIESTVGLDVAVTVGSNRAVPTSMNQGSPILESDPRSAVARGFTELVQRFAPEFAGTSPQAAAAPNSLLRRVKGTR